MINELTPAQIKAIPEYTKMGIKIGLDVGPEFDEAEVRDLTDKHRELLGLQKATEFIIFDSPMAACKEIEGLSPSNALFGQHDINWIANYLFFRIECGLIKETEKIVYLAELAKKVGWMWMSDDTTIVTRRPKHINMKMTQVRNENQSETNDLLVLHNPNGLALEYADGNGVYALYGTRIPKEYQWVVTEKGQYDVKRVLGIKNAAIRTAALRAMGPRALITTGTCLHEWESSVGGKYVLYSVEVNGNNRIYLSGECPSKHEPFCEAVHPDVKTCQEALAWREDEVDLVGYSEPLYRT
jgi:hypothetical protein